MHWHPHYTFTTGVEAPPAAVSFSGGGNPGIGMLKRLRVRSRMYGLYLRNEIRSFLKGI